MLPNQPIKTTAALALALAAITPAAASASPLGGATQTQSQTSPTVRVIVPNRSFDWGDAGIGAAGGLALSMLGLGGALAISQRRPRHPYSPPTPTS